MNIKKIQDIQNLEGKKILLRVDFNVPLTQDGKVQDDSRIKGALPTIKHLKEKGAKIILISHLGRPKGIVKEALRLNEVAKCLESLLNAEVKKSDTVIGKDVEDLISTMNNGEIAMLENIRFHKEESECEPEFVKELAKLGDIFVNDAFATAHRHHCSTCGLAEHLEAFAGLLMQKEIEHLSPILNSTPKAPLTMIFGGAKIDTKIGVIKNFLSKADYFLMGGGLANTFIHAKGLNIGESLCEKDKTDLAQSLMQQGEFIIPTDVVVAEEISETAATQTLNAEDVEGSMKILDIGPQTAEKFSEIIEKSGTVIWNGPVGLSEFTPFADGSKKVAEAVAESKAVSIVGGGDTADCIKRFKVPQEKFTHISTGGGAAIEFLAGTELPGIKCLMKS